ncbi:MAG TPA: hypothetical protein VIV11_33100, partial [Kofleriaceae bacterium]
MVTDDEREWLTAETADLLEEVGIERYVANPLVEASDRWFPDEWHPDDGGVARLAKRVFGYAGLADVEITTDLASEDTGFAIIASELDHARVALVVDPEHLTDALTAVATLVDLAARVFRIRHDLVVTNEDEEKRLCDLTTIFLGFGIITTNAAYRYRASGGLEGNVAVTRWTHSEQGTLSASVMAYALAMQVVVRADASERRAVSRQLERNQAEVFDAACADLAAEHPDLALKLPPRSEWPQRREPPPSPARAPLQLRKKQSSLPQATVKNRSFLGHNTGKPVLRNQESRAISFGFAALFLAMVPTIALAVDGQGVAATLALVGVTALGFFVGHKIRHDICFGRGCGIKLPADIERCPRCGGNLVGRMLKGENLLEAEERLGLEEPDEELEEAAAA